MSDTERLVLKTKKSLYGPIVIEVDETLYESVKLTRVVLDEMTKIEKERTVEDDKKDSNNLINYRLVNFIFKVPMKTLDLLDKREVEDIVLFMQKKLQTTETERLKAAAEAFKQSLGDKVQAKRLIPKNLQRPGGKR